MRQEIGQPRNVGAFVRASRLSRGMTQRQLAERAGVSERSVLSLEMGDATGIRLDKLMAILKALDARLYISEEPEYEAENRAPCEADAVPSPTRTVEYEAGNRAPCDTAISARLVEGQSSGGAISEGAGLRDVDASQPAAEASSEHRAAQSPLDFNYEELYGNFLRQAQEGPRL